MSRRTSVMSIVIILDPLFVIAYAELRTLFLLLVSVFLLGMLIHEVLDQFFFGDVEADAENQL